MSAKSFRKWARNAEAQPEFWTERAIIRMAEEIHRELNRQGLTRAELARRLGFSPAYVTKILRGNANFTLESMVKIARALGAELRISLDPAPASASQPSAGKHNAISEVREPAARWNPKRAARRAPAKK